MTKRFLKIWWAGIVLTASLLLVYSCEDKVKPEQNALSVSARLDEVSADAGSIFVAVTASGPWTLDLEFQSGSEPWAEIDTKSGTGNKSNIILKYEKNSQDSGRMLHIVVRSKSASDSFVLLQKAESGSGENPEPPVVQPDGIPGWMELPVVQGGLEYHNNFFSMNGKRYRNYSYGWDKKALVAHWVAYPLCPLYLGSQKRTNEWDYDPNVPQSQQPVLFSGFGGSGYDRGHQLPSGDRTCCREANEQTFYFTNMTPQRGANFNQKIWASFETRVRDWSRNADTLYVVTGCLVEGSTLTARDNDGKSVTVPVGYFKALLWYSKSSTVTANNKGYRAAAFYLEHKNYSQSGIDKSMSMSVDELEKLVGMNFFPNLASRVGEAVAARVEAADPGNDTFWWNN